MNLAEFHERVCEPPLAQGEEKVRVTVVLLCFDRTSERFSSTGETSVGLACFHVAVVCCTFSNACEWKNCGCLQQKYMLRSVSTPLRFILISFDVRYKAHAVECQPRSCQD